MFWFIFIPLLIIFLCLFISKASREDRLISKYLLSDFEKPKEKIKATLTAIPKENLSCEEWMDYIGVERNTPTN